MEEINPHCEGLEPYFDVFSFGTIELAAQTMASEGSQVAYGISEKLGVSDVMFLGAALDAHYGRVGSAAAVDLNLREQLKPCVDGSGQPL